jgi:hypothetical protein
LTVDEEKQSGPSRRRKVLRAKDVIPPFDTIGHAPPDPARREHRADRNGGTGLQSTEETEIPMYDLAENILAEQRRAAGRRRRAPGQVQEVPGPASSAAGVRMFVSEIGSPDLLELQRLVAEIVARDIDRLCQRPDRPHVARASCL